ncbi:MAG: PD40 domain-containing protein [Candidatus Riflebacteria bacterium]|nr:PD40 domain-containing protein [Candidatus Riflebacteria bacterium]
MADYIVDPFLGRIVSRGPNGVLETPIVGFAESVASSPSDDLLEIYEPQGTIGCLVSETARAVTLDGAPSNYDVLTGVDCFALTPDRETALVVQSSTLRRVRKMISEQVVENLGATPAGSEFSELAVSPDGRRYAATAEDGATLWIGPATADPGSAAYKLYTATDETMSGPAWGRDGQELAVCTSKGNVWRLAVAAGAQPVVLAADASTDGTKNTPSWSADGKWIAYASKNAGTLGLTSPVKAPDTAGIAVRTVKVDFAGSNVGPVAWSPSRQKLAFLANGELWLVEAANPTRRLQLTSTTIPKFTSGKGLCWR